MGQMTERRANGRPTTRRQPRRGREAGEGADAPRMTPEAVTDAADTLAASAGGAMAAVTPNNAERETSADLNHSYIAADLQALAFPVADLTEHPDNARRHTERDIPILMESLLRYGQRKPIVAKHEYRGMTNVVIAGNGTRTAAMRLMRGHLAVTWFDGSDEEADEYALVDNRTAELSTWDLEILARQLRTMHARTGQEGLERMGWTQTEAGPLLAAEWHPAAPGHLPGREVSWRAVSLSLAQWLVLELCIQRIQSREGDPSMPEGRCVELMAADFLGGPDTAMALDRPANE